MSLYREEALEWRARWKNSQILIAPERHSILITIVLLLIFAMLLYLLFFTNTVRQIEVEGTVVAEQGQSPLRSPRHGLLKRLLVPDGAHVRIGQPVAELTSDEFESNETSEIVFQKISLLKSRLNMLENKRIALRELFRPSSTISKESLHASNNSRGCGYEANNEQPNNENTKRQVTLIESVGQFHVRESNAYRETDKNNHNNCLKFIQADIELQEAILAVKQNIIDLSEKSSWIVSAPRNGILRDVNVVEGDAIEDNGPIATILHGNGTLIAKIYVPEGVAASIDKGQRIKLHQQNNSGLESDQWNAVVNRIAIVQQQRLHPNSLDRKYLVTLNFLDPTTNKSLSPGMAVKATIMLKQKNPWERLHLPLKNTSSKN